MILIYPTPPTKKPQARLKAQEVQSRFSLNTNPKVSKTSAVLADKIVTVFIFSAQELAASHVHPETRNCGWESFSN